MEKKVLVETSARHVHLTEEHIAILFGEGATLTFKKALSQPVSLHARSGSPWWDRKNPFPM